VSKTPIRPSLSVILYTFIIYTASHSVITDLDACLAPAILTFSSFLPSAFILNIARNGALWRGSHVLALIALLI